MVDDGWVTIEVMLKFHRLSQLTKDADVIMNALKKSNSGLMELSDSAQKIRRSTDKPIPEDSDERKQEMKLKTVYCKGFPREGATIDKLLDFFKEYPTVENVKVMYCNIYRITLLLIMEMLSLDEVLSRQSD